MEVDSKYIWAKEVVVGVLACKNGWNLWNSIVEKKKKTAQGGFRSLCEGLHWSLAKGKGGQEG